MSQEKKSVADHMRHLLERIVQLEKNVEGLGDIESRLRSPRGPRTHRPQPTGPPLIDRDVLAQVIELENRLGQIEEENQTLSQTCTQLQEQNEAISNLYVAKHRLHASLDATEIMNIVTEILVELVGAEEFAILFLEQKTKVLKRVSGRGAKIGSDTVPLTEGILGRVASSGKPFYGESLRGVATNGRPARCHTLESRRHIRGRDRRLSVTAAQKRFHSCRPSTSRARGRAHPERAPVSSSAPPQQSEDRARRLIKLRSHS